MVRSALGREEGDVDIIVGEGSAGPPLLPLPEEDSNVDADSPLDAGLVDGGGGAGVVGGRGSRLRGRSFLGGGHGGDGAFEKEGTFV